MADGIEASGEKALVWQRFCLSELKSKHECQMKIRVAVAVVVEVLCARDFVVRNTNRGIKRLTAETNY